MRTILSAFVVTLMFATSCATTGKTRILIGAGIGAGTLAVSGNILSPNDESRALNALVFGLVGAIAGGTMALLTDPRPTPSEAKTTLRDRDQGAPSGNVDILVQPSQSLPQFVKDRLQPLVIEESIQADSVTEEGTLHEPHKIYRIKHLPELDARPVTSAGGNSK